MTVSGFQLPSSAGLPQLFPEDTAQRIFERFPLPFDVFDKGIVDQGTGLRH
jgi:hypothetical protein